MNLTQEDLRTISRAKFSEKAWKIGRVINVTICIAAIAFGFWLISNTEIVLNPLSHWIIQPIFILAGTLIGYTFNQWEDRERQLLLRLASETDEDSA